MKIEPKNQCPLHNFEPCKQLECAWFLKIQGTNPNTGKDVEEWGCAVAWLPTLLIENAQMSRQTGAAVESFRNEMVKTNEEVLRLNCEIGKTSNAVARLLGSIARAAASRSQVGKIEQ